MGDPRKKRVLIVDDEEDTLKLLKMIVELSGYEADTTLNSLDALTMAQVEQPDVVILDIMMPKLDGFQLCKMLRANPKTRQLPIIFVTAYSALDLDDRRKESGGDMVLPKPVGMDQLIEAIDKVQTLERNIPQEIERAASDITLAKSPFFSKPLTVPVTSRPTETTKAVTVDSPATPAKADTTTPAKTESTPTPQTAPEPDKAATDDKPPTPPAEKSDKTDILIS